jgi:3-keto-5-aminohexanoate cleavage enzyme
MDDLPPTWRYGDTREYLERVRAGMPPLIVTCAVNGGIQGRESHPALPETPEQIADQAAEAYAAGASIVHIHGRDPANLANGARDAEVFLETNRLVRERCPDLVINNTTGGGPTTTMDDRYRCLQARPELASLNMGPDMSRFRLPARREPLPHPHDELVYDDCIPFTYGIIRRLAELMRTLGIKPEMEVYHPGQMWAVNDVVDAGLLEPPYMCQFVMGYQTSSFATPDHLMLLVRELPAGAIFFVCGIGWHQLPMTTLSILLGGHVRVGLEDNLYYRRGRKLEGNGEAVARAVRIAGELNREVATPAQARAMLGLAAAPSRYEDVVLTPA